MKTQCVLKVAALTFLAANVFDPSHASAFITYYSDAAAWQAAVGTSVTEPFNSTGLQPFTAVSTVAGGIGAATGVFSGSVWKDSMYNNPFNYSSTTFSYAPGQLIGAGALWDTAPNGEGIGIDIAMNGGSESVGHIGGIHGFFGWTSSTPFNSFVLSIYFLQNGGGETFDMDNLQFAPVPEPGSITILALGLIGMGLARRSAKN